MTPNAVLPIRILIAVGDSDPCEVGTVDLDVEWVLIPDESRRPGDSVEAEARVENFDLAGALRRIADGLERPDEG